MTSTRAAEPIAPGVRRVRVPMPPGTGLPFSNAYLIEDADGAVHVIDPGSPTAEAREALRAALGAAPVASMVLTHLHADHSGGAAALAHDTGASVLVHERERAALGLIAAGFPAPDLEAWGVPAERRPELLAAAAIPTEPAAELVDAVITGVLADGQLLDIPGRRLRVVGTPGHTDGHLCLHDEEAGLLLTGDHVLPTVNSGLGLGGPTATNPVADYLASLDRVAQLDRGDLRALPGHEDPFGGLRERCAELAAHQLRRAEEVAAHPAGTVWEAAGTLTWTGGWDGLAGFTLLSALRQTAQHREFVARRV
ncbi:MBL fold metallo-hydrolase [Leifsonia shinshuensis]|uniref:MBL fold metallo-hydrolase n=1 Tax=Leifsonia shinshuensis TaxID=150026 RepID=A0A7G6Y8P0_9MICO|nr:MBL fold metallo-hydrolase [Leifsonia shinshuensis]QNE34855.1 MBL fold metallo-hydrolase [Leifsonia shinshuensis]